MISLGFTALVMKEYQGFHCEIFKILHQTKYAAFAAFEKKHYYSHNNAFKSTLRWFLEMISDTIFGSIPTIKFYYT